VKYQCNNCKKEFEIPGELETITVSNQYTSIPYTPYFTSSSPTITITVRKQICPYCHQLDFHEIKEAEG